MPGAKNGKWTSTPPNVACSNWERVKRGYVQPTHLGRQEVRIVDKEKDLRVTINKNLDPRDNINNTVSTAYAHGIQLL